MIFRVFELHGICCYFCYKLILLRNSDKIKAVVFLIAWCMIFAHGIIPHNHINDVICGHAGLIHDHHNSGNGIAEFSSLCRDYESCSISNILFQKFSTGDNLLSPGDRSYTDPVITTVDYKVTSDQKAPSGWFACLALLRAPPVA